MKFTTLLLFLVAILTFSGCKTDRLDTSDNSLILAEGKYPTIAEHNGSFYFIRQAPPADMITIYSTKQIDKLVKNDSTIVWNGPEKGMYNIWSPYITRIDGRWLIYFEADNGNTDNHQIYVIENPNEDPTKGEWALHGPIITNREWNFGIHPSTIIVNDRQYLLWSGWEHRRVEAETQCIFIAEMANPWTLKSERVMISQPEYEWERQWINPDGSRSAYPIFVNEDPEAIVSPDGKKIIIGYSASGIWTRYNSLGLLYASTSSDLLNPKSWTKMAEPQFLPSKNDSTMYGTSNIALLTTPDGVTHLFYQAKIDEKGYEETNIYHKTIGWDKNSLPIFGVPR